MEQLRRDLDNGIWEERNADLRQERELDVGLRLAIAELDTGGSG